VAANPRDFSPSSNFPRTIFLWRAPFLCRAGARQDARGARRLTESFVFLLTVSIFFYTESFVFLLTVSIFFYGEFWLVEVGIIPELLDKKT
jgi:hypothetical protein